MKQKIFLFILSLLFFMPVMEVQAQDYNMKAGKTIKAGYAGKEETAYHYFKVKPSKNGYIAITAKTSDESALVMDICNDKRETVATDISIFHKKTVLHKVKKAKTYYLRIKGTPDVTYSISYKMNTFSQLSYAKKYSYTFTNASLKSKSDGLLLKIKCNYAGNLNFMCSTKSKLKSQYLNSKKKVISNTDSLKGNCLTGIGAKADKTYYIRLWNAEKTTSGTTTISNMKYQIKNVTPSYNNSRGKSYTLTKNTYKESFVPADAKSTYWYKVNLTKDQKLSIYVESRILQMNGSCLQLDLYNRDGKKITSKSIKIDEEAYAVYKKKKYKMKYPVKNLTTGKLPSDTYYIRIVSKSKKTSGSFRVKWK